MTVLRTPADLGVYDLSIPDRETLVGTLRHQELERYLTKLSTHIPEMTEGVTIGNREFGPLVPRPYQIRYGAMGALRRVNIFGYEAGAGKTLTAELSIYGVFPRKLFTEGKLRKGVIHIASTPLSLDLTWKNELTRVGLGPYCAVVTNEKQLRETQAPIIIYHHDFVKMQTAKGKYMKRHRHTRTRTVKGKVVDLFYGEPMYKLMRKIAKPSFLIIDEIHRFRPETDRTETMTELRKSADWFLGLTGTPIDGWIDQIGAIFKLAYGEDKPWLPYTMQGFEKTFTQVQVTSNDYVTGSTEGKTRRIVAPGVPQHLLPKFYDLVSHLMHRLLFEDDEVSPYVVFPEADHQLRLVTLSEQHQASYTALYSTIQADMELAIQLMNNGSISRIKARNTVLPMLMSLRQMATHPWEIDAPYTSLQVDESAKLDELVKILHEMKAQGRKAVVFTHFVPSGRKIMERLQAEGIGCHRIYAEDPKAKPRTLSRKRRTEVVTQFMDDDSTALIANLELMAESVTLSEVASCVIHYEHGWKSVLWEQGNKRVVRPGQLFARVPVIDLVAAGTIEFYIYQHVQNKLRANQRTVDRKFDNAAEDVSDTMAVIGQILATQTVAA